MRSISISRVMGVNPADPLQWVAKRTCLRKKGNEVVLAFYAETLN